VSSSIALTRVFPVLFAGDAADSKDPNAIRSVAQRMAELVHLADGQVSLMLAMDLQALKVAPHTTESDIEPSSSTKPVVLDDDTYELISEELEQILVEQTLRRHPGIRPTWDAALARLRRRREDDEKAPSSSQLQNGGHFPNGLALGGVSDMKDSTPGTTPSVSGGTFRFLSPDSDDGRDYRPRSSSKRARSSSPPRAAD